MEYGISGRLCFIGLVTVGVLGIGHLGPERVMAAEKSAFKLVHIAMFEPFAVAKEGKSEGLAIDIIQETLARVNIKAVFAGEHQDKLDGLVSKGEADGLAFQGINAERRKTYDFSEPYLMSGGALFVKTSGPPSFELKEFEGKTVATPQKGPLAGYIQEKFPKVKVLTEVKDYPETLRAVLDGKADAAALNTQSGAVLAKQLFPGKFWVPKKGFLEVPIGIAVLKGKQDYFLAKFNEGLKAVLADGTYEKLLEKWGVPAATKPSNR